MFCLLFRDIVTAVMECKARLDWRSCKASEEEESVECSTLQELFKPYVNEIELKIDENESS
jgi:hypothetical protein